jgi:peptidoglycan/xylan/chitin deacetylase (PgdA/CDA1 family)
LNRERICFLVFSVMTLVCNTAVTSSGTETAAKAEIPRPQMYVALTFDDGPKADTTPALLEGLRQRKVHATFFLIGSQIAPNAALVRQMKAEGHQIGNHTWSHKKLQGASDAVVQTEINRTDRALRSLLGDGEYWVRPPYGLLSERQRRLFSVPLVRWSVDPKDWKRRNAEGDVAAVLRAVKPGDIILMHDSFHPSVTAALRIVDALQQRGYRFVTVSQLFTAQGTTPRPGTVYCSAAK